jgi:hypothetical protein
MGLGRWIALSKDFERLDFRTKKIAAKMEQTISKGEATEKRLRQLQRQLGIFDLMELFPFRRPDDRARWI